MVGDGGGGRWRRPIRERLVRRLRPMVWKTLAFDARGRTAAAAAAGEKVLSSTTSAAATAKYFLMVTLLFTAT